MAEGVPQQVASTVPWADCCESGAPALGGRVEMRERKASSVRLSWARWSKGKGASVAMLKCSKRVRTRGRETSLLAMKVGQAAG